MKWNRTDSLPLWLDVDEKIIRFVILIIDHLQPVSCLVAPSEILPDSF